MENKRLLWIFIGIIVLIGLVLGYVRPRMMLAEYHSEQVLEWTTYLSRKLMTLGSRYEIHSDHDELASSLQEIRMEFRYLEMFIGHHSEKLYAISGSYNVRAELGNGFYGIWTSLQESSERLEERRPADFDERRDKVSDEIYNLGEKMSSIVREPEASVYFGVQSLSQKQAEELNELLREAAALIEYAAGID